MTAASDDEVIRVLVARLARPHRSGGLAVERAALLAAGADFRAATTWIHARGGRSEAPPARAARGLHGARQAAGEGPPMRYILPPGALNRAPDGGTEGQETP